MTAIHHPLSIMFAQPANRHTVSPDAIALALGESRAPVESSDGDTVQQVDQAPGLDGWVTQKQLAVMLKTTPRTVRRMVDRRELPQPIKLGRNKMWSLTRVNEFQDRRAERADKAAAEREALTKSRRQA